MPAKVLHGASRIAAAAIMLSAAAALGQDAGQGSPSGSEILVLGDRAIALNTTGAPSGTSASSSTKFAESLATMKSSS